ncbi:ANTAR domain-containing protein [Plantibacter sp. MPB07]|uniref:ANTAR domain-containing protein n=1 Tax=Plantibacter sp. MPB07 TaxID=3388853 RepID=UPI003987DFFB
MSGDGSGRDAGQGLDHGAGLGHGTGLGHGAELLEVFATLADTLIDDYDVVDLLQTLVDASVDLLDVDASGILLADQHGDLDLIASTSESSRLVELIQLSADEGPCIESFRGGMAVAVPEISAVAGEWPRFAQAAADAGFASVYAVPLRLRRTTIGTLNLFRTASEDLDELETRAAQAMADVATIGILHERTLRASDAAREQLERALQSRVTIEQAKGVVAFTASISVEDAFERLRTHARSSRRSLADVARDVVERRLEL